MEDKDLKKMIEKFFNAELSIEEERELCGYLCLHDVPEGLRKDKEAIIALCGDELSIYSGNDDQIVPLMSVGGKGVISVL